jgi:hypothetical protein
MLERRPATTIDDDLRWTSVSVGQRCPVCGAPGGCGVAPFRGGVAVDCRNVASSWPMTDGGWLHRLPADESVDDASHDADGATCAFPLPTARITGASSSSASPSDGRREPE